MRAKAKDLGTKRKQAKGRKPMKHVRPAATPNPPMLQGIRPKSVKP